MLLSSTTTAAALLWLAVARGARGGGPAGGDADPADAGGQRPDGPRRPRQDPAAGGRRLQARRHPGAGAPRTAIEVRIFTRSLDEITERLPEVVRAVRGAAGRRRWCSTGRCWRCAPTADRRPSSWSPPGPRASADVAAVSSRTAAAGLLLRPAARGRPRPARRAAHRAAARRWTRSAAARADGRAADRSPTADELADVFDSRGRRGFEGVVVKQPALALRRRPAAGVLDQDQTPAHLRPAGDRGGVGVRPAAGLAVQPPPGGPRPGSGRPSCSARPSRA